MFVLSALLSVGCWVGVDVSCPKDTKAHIVRRVLVSRFISLGEESMKYEDLPQTIKVGEMLLKRDAENATCVYYNNSTRDGVHAHICYSKEGEDFCGHVSIFYTSLFDSLGGHKSRFHPDRSAHCYVTIEPLVKVMEQKLEEALMAVFKAMRNKSP